MHVAAEQFSKPETRRIHRAVVLFPNLYLWLVFLASLDIILTRVILFFSGIEMNPIAKMVIDAFGVPGMAVFKFSVVSFVIIVCEVVGRTRRMTAQKLAVFAVLITGFPVVWSSVLVGSIIATGEHPPLEDDPARHKTQSVEYAPDSDHRNLQHGRAAAWSVRMGASESSSLEVASVVPILPRH
ncbi:MAG: DUF5658 family protein [Phycisphaerales bacterium]|jgi:hypothetical protein|nr:DUF5658 family protein [Phycisphaerales bacterium]MDP7087407.1 DUF5658 family protein [Phycisphaerales bacterium]MDP7188524.1 DUF5658 family protein [Phycisphaerales bacterium]MDP7518813.1 DUF5658 family protein [Phycisphaerales bacterium]HJN80074.1 DUF5658 family protein [Phycisphaerales bacterium]